MSELTMNLQLFADGENIEDNANLDADVVEDQNVENDGDQQPDLNENTSEEQSKDKENPANHAFAEMRRKLKEQEQQLQSYVKKQTETDEYYANIARSKGRTDIKTADEYFKAVRQEELSAAYQETQDPMKLVELIKESIMSEIKPQVQQPIVDNGLEKELEEFNKTFKQNLKSIDEITTLPNNEEILQYMMNGIPLHKAYAAANPEKISAANKQAVINQVKGLSHVKGNSNSGNIEKINVSQSEIAQWKQWFPGKTDEQCRKEIVANKKLFEE